MRKSRIWIAAVALSYFAALAPAQCVMGVYADQAGTIGTAHVSFAAPFEIYVVLHVESTVAGAAYTMSWPGDFGISPISFGPNGNGINVPGGGGNNVGLGECAIGFNSTPVVVATYSAVQTSLFFSEGYVTLGPNTDEDLNFPVFADCADQLIACPATSDLYLFGVGVESRSLGAVKALYGN